jgi:hypothetical protein
MVRAACAQAGITLDVVGQSSGNPTATPELVLQRYDVVFAKARAALEAMAVGAAVILCDVTGLGPMVTSSELGRLRPLNFGFRTLTSALEPEAILAQLARYDPADAAEVSRQVRSTAGLEAAVDRIVAVYEAVAEEHRAAPGSFSAGEDDRAIASYLRWLNPYLKERTSLEQERDALRWEVDRLGQALARQSELTAQLGAGLVPGHRTMLAIRMLLHVSASMRRLRRLAKATRNRSVAP